FDLRTAKPQLHGGMNNMQRLPIRSGFFPKILRRQILRSSLWPFVPLVAGGVLASAGALIWAESPVKSGSPVVLERLDDGSICPHGASSLPVESDLGFDGGDIEWSKGHPAAAIHKWTHAAQGFSGWEWPLPALLRGARRYAKRGDQKEAIDAYKKIL